MSELDHQELEALREKKWDIMDELAAVELAITSLLNRIRGNSEVRD